MLPQPKKKEILRGRFYSFVGGIRYMAIRVRNFCRRFVGFGYPPKTWAAFPHSPPFANSPDNNGTGTAGKDIS